MAPKKPSENGVQPTAIPSPPLLLPSLLSSPISLPSSFPSNLARLPDSIRIVSMEEGDGNPVLNISNPTLITASTNPAAKSIVSTINSDAVVPKIFYSQPLASGISYTAARRKGGRNHSLDDEDCGVAGNNTTDDVNGTNTGSNTRLYMHSSSLPEETLRRHRPPVHHQIDRALTSAIPTTIAEHEAMAVAGANPASLPEFMGKGGGKGIFKVPVRGAVHMNRPPPLDLRPHPLRETQVGTFLRTIGCSESQVWAGQESGVRVWDLEKAFHGWDEAEPMIRVLKGDEESAPFQESRRISPALCLVVDVGNRLVWSGHKDGKIRSWKMDLPQSKLPSDSAADAHGDAARTSNSTSNNANSGSSSASAATATTANSGFMESLTWQAHPTPVLCMTFTSQGDLWSGSEGGVIKVWPWESLEKSLTLGERHMAALLVERSFVDLRSQVTVGGVCSLPSSDVRFLVSDHSRSKIWSGASVSFALWNSRTKELIRVFNIDGHVENKVDSLSTSSGHDAHAEDEIKVKVVSTSKRERNQLSFFQRSRNALMGAADVVRRVATKGTFGEDNRKTEAMIISTDGMIWTGCSSGAIVQWDGNANRLQEFQHQSSSVLSLCSFGTRLWVGYSNGSIQMMDLEGNLLGGWVAHSSPVIKMAVAGGYIFTLANHGGVRGWHLTAPGPLDDILRLQLGDKGQLFTKFENCKILVGTWNVGQERASHDSLSSWVGTASSEADIVIIGCQEVEMGAGFLAMAAAKETVGLEGSANGHWWLDAIGKTLDEGKVFDRIGSRQLAGLLIAVWAKKHIRKHIGDIDAGAVACGFGRAIGNKGGVGLRMRIYDRTLCLANCHFAAHLEAVNKRNADFDHIFRTMSFSRPSIGPHSYGAGASSSIQVVRGPNGAAFQSDDGSPELSDADMIIFLGDFNYRLHGISYDEARDFVSQRCFDWLREKDQLREEMKSGRVFQGMREGLIRFPPTYKFDRHKPGLSGYDSGEKKRIPAWCDRILYRDNRSISLQECSLECPVVSSVLHYDACMDVTDSDHKPVRCLINVDIARSDNSVKRQNLGEILMSNKQIRSFLLEICTVPEISVSTSSTVLQNMDTTVIDITNRCQKNKAIIEISCEGQSSINKEDGSISEPHPRGGSGFPRWLEVVPTTDVIQPGQIMELSLRHEEGHALDEVVDGIPQNWMCEDTRDKEVIVTVTVKGNYTVNRTSHQIHVRHSFTSRTATSGSKTATSESKTANSDSKNATSGSKTATSSDSRASSRITQKPDFKHHNISTDKADDPLQPPQFT